MRFGNDADYNPDFCTKEGEKKKKLDFKPDKVGNFHFDEFLDVTVPSVRQ